MSQPYVGEIRIFAGNFPPVGWMFCEGQILPIAENEVLFQLIGTTYGGDGESTFALPDLRGRVPIHMGNSFTIGETGGVEEVTLTVSQIPPHEHLMLGATAPAKVFVQALAARTGTSSDPATGYPTMVPGLQQYAKTPSQNTFSKPVMASIQTPTAGGSQPHSNMQPFLCVNFIISLFGVYPSQT